MTRGRLSGALLVLVTALAPIAWGTTYSVTTELLPAGRPFLAGAIRALVAGIGLTAMTRVRPRGVWWVKAAVLGLLNVGIFFPCLFLAAYRLPGGVAATLGAVQPLIAAGLAALLLKERLRWVIVIAGLLGLAGVALLVLRADARLDAVGVVAGLGGAVSMATGVVLTKRWGNPTGLLAFTGWQLLAGGICLVPLTLVAEGLPGSLDVGNVLGYLWLATAGGAVAYSLWFRGVALLPVAQTTILALLSPVVAAIIGVAVLDQSLSVGQVAGMLMILVAIWLGQTYARRPLRARPEGAGPALSRDR